MLLFITGRYEFRKTCTLAYSPVAQSLILAGLEKQLWQELIVTRMCRKIGALRALASSLRIMELCRGIVSFVRLRSGGRAPPCK